MVVAIGFINEDEHCVIGSGVMIAPGLCLTATHVIEETKRKHALVYTFANENSMRIWRPEDFHAHKGAVELIPFQKPEEKFSDVGILSCSPFSSFSDDEEFIFAPIEVSILKVGERLWTTGYRETSNDGVPTIAFFLSSGLVTEQYIEGRGSHLKGPCIEVAMKALGGMSGGAVFNVEGRIVGVISSCLEGQSDNMGPTYVSLVWPSLLSTVYTPWPKNYWPNQLGGIQIPSNYESVKVLGSATWDEDGIMRVTFPEQSEDSILSILKLANISFPELDYEFSDFSYDNFEAFLENEGLIYLSAINKEKFNRSLAEDDSAETIKLFECIDSDCHEGIEDLDVKSVSLLENGHISIDATFNIRGVFVKLEMAKPEHDYYRQQISDIQSFHNQEISEDKVSYEHYIRPYYRVNFSYNAKKSCCENIRFQLLSLKL